MLNWSGSENNMNNGRFLVHEIRTWRCTNACAGKYNCTCVCVGMHTYMHVLKRDTCCSRWRGCVRVREKEREREREHTWIFVLRYVWVYIRIHACMSLSKHMNQYASFQELCWLPKIICLCVCVCVCVRIYTHEYVCIRIHTIFTHKCMQLFQNYIYKKSLHTMYASFSQLHLLPTMVTYAETNIYTRA